MTTIVHLSPSALAGSPGMLSDAQSRFGGHQATHLRLGDHGPRRDLMSPNSVSIQNNSIDQAIFFSKVAQADIIHVHNFIPRYALEWLAQTRVITQVPFIYQTHSPYAERPIFADLSDEHGITWAGKIAVAQAHPRMYPDFSLLPNCLYRPGQLIPDPLLLPAPEIISVLYSPSTTAGGRWTSKGSEAFQKNITALAAESDRLSVSTINDWPPQKLLELRKLCHITIDEVITGGFHLISYEGLAVGNVVINGAYNESIACMMAALKTNDQPPFVVANDRSVARVVHSLSDDRERLENIRQESARYFWQWLNPGRVVGLYDSFYSEVG